MRMIYVRQGSEIASPFGKQAATGVVENAAMSFNGACLTLMI